MYTTFTRFVSNRLTVKSNVFLKSCLGQSKGGRKELVSEAVRRAGMRPGRGEAVLPRRRQRAEDVVRQQVRGAHQPPARSLPLHADHGRPHKELRVLAIQSR